MGCKFEFHAYSGCFSSGSYSMPMNLRMHSHEFLFHANESQTAFHEFKFLSPCQWISDCIPWVPIPCQWISECIPMSSGSYSPALWISDCIPWVQVPISLPMNLRMHSHDFLSPCQIFGVFWLGTTHVLPSWFRNVHRRSKNRILARFKGWPYTYHMGTPKIA